MPDAHANLIAKLEAMSREFDELDLRLGEPEALADHALARELSIKRGALADLVERYRRYAALVRQAEEHRQIIADRGDPELAALAREELPGLETQAAALLEGVSNDLV